MKKQKKENNLMKENEKMNRHPVALSDEMLEQVNGGQTGEVVLIDHDIPGAEPEEASLRSGWYGR